MDGGAWWAAVHGITKSRTLLSDFTHTVKDFDVLNKAEISFSGTLLLFQGSNGCLQFDLWCICLFEIQLEYLEFHSSCTVEPGLENFEHYFTTV